MKDLVNNILIRQDQTVLVAISMIESTNHQIALVVDNNHKLLGIVTNGDVRRFLMNGGKTDSKVTECMNTHYRYVNTSCSRETVLKLFDLGHRAIPILDDSGLLIDFATPDFFPPSREGDILARSRAPVRISFSGGGSDLTYYFINNKGIVLHSAISLYAHSTLIPSSGSEIKIISHDIDKIEIYSSLSELIDSPHKGLLSSVISVIRPEFGFELFVHSDFPVGSGLGGSSAVAISVVSVFNELRMDKWSTYEVSELAFQAERLCFGVDGGWQDQYASAFGGFNLIEFDGKQNLVHQLRLADALLDELEECFVLCDTGIKHDSGKLHSIQRLEYEKVDHKLQVDQMVKLSRQMHEFLIRADLKAFGECLHQAWVLKRDLSSAISNSKIDEIYNVALQAGASGGKLLGAGGGGFFLFFILPRYRSAVYKCLKKLGCKLSNLRFDREGVKSWRAKIL
jgi:D-glycero-alpha-D-manno-heptose-7-phosphate kinase